MPPFQLFPTFYRWSLLLLSTRVRIESAKISVERVPVEPISDRSESTVPCVGLTLTSSSTLLLSSPRDVVLRFSDLKQRYRAVYLVCIEGIAKGEEFQSCDSPLPRHQSHELEAPKLALEFPTPPIACHTYHNIVVRRPYRLRPGFLLTTPFS